MTRQAEAAQGTLRRRGPAGLRGRAGPGGASGRGFQTDAQALRELNRAGRAEEVVARFESGRLAVTEQTVGEYVKALVRMDRLEGAALMRTIHKGAAAEMAQAQAAAPASGALGALGGGAPGAAGVLAAGVADGGAGSAKDPLYIRQVEPGFGSQFWKTVRTLGVAFIVLSGLGAFLEDRGMTKNILSNQEVRPTFESSTRFADVKGVDEAKAELQEIVQYLKDPKQFTGLGGKLPKGALLVGPPGTGKTMLARAIAGEAGVPFFYTSGSEFEEMFVGVGARRIRDLFSAAKQHSPCIIFIDEIDAVGGKRSPKDQQYLKMTLNQLLVEMDGFKQNDGIIVIGATNFPESLDKALTRPGRFDRHVVVPNPDVKGRTEILESHFKTIPRASDVDLSVIARGTPGFSGADLANLVNVAALKASMEKAKVVTMASLEYAKDKILMGTERKSAVISEENRKLTAYHEGGHALVAMYTEGAHPVHKATIVPRGMALGMVMQLPSKDETSISYKQLLARLDVCMGGRVAEEMIFGEDEVTTGASSDLQQATNLARAMVTRYGYSSKIGKVVHNYENNGFNLSTETRQEIENEVKILLNEAYDRAKHILKTHEKELHTLANKLLEEETLSGKQIHTLLNIKMPGKAKEKGAVASSA